MNEKEMINVYALLLEMQEKTNALSIPALQILVCMLLEEGCKAHNYNMLTCVNGIVDAAQYVNETYGEY